MSADSLEANLKPGLPDLGNPFLDTGGYIDRCTKFKSFSKYPTAKRDISIVVDSSVSYGKIVKVLKKLSPGAEEV